MIVRVDGIKRMSTIKDLHIGKVYSIHHRRKGYFIGRLLEVIKAEPGDEADSVLLQFEIDVRPGTDQNRLANAGNEATAIRNIRPSLILSIEETDAADWLRTIYVPPPQPSPVMQQAEIIKAAMKLIEGEKQPSWWDRLKRSLRTER